MEMTRRSNAGTRKNPTQDANRKHRDLLARTIGALRLISFVAKLIPKNSPKSRASRCLNE
jgi:hypothetical protein